MRHALDVRLRFHIDEGEVWPGESPREAAARLLREVMTANDEVVEIRAFSWTWTSRPVMGS
jgi:hypothetical protein